MNSNSVISVLCGILLLAGANEQKKSAGQHDKILLDKDKILKSPGQCRPGEFWNHDIEQCVPCSTCKQYPKTPSCEMCVVPDSSSDVWKLAAITSFSVLAVLLVSTSALLVGVLVHLYKTGRKSPLREPIEETTGPLYQV